MKNDGWDEIYGTSDPSPSPFTGKFTTNQSSIGEGSIYVSQSEFSECKATSSNGGAILVSFSSAAKTLIEKSIFNICEKVSSGSGGAIYIDGEWNTCAILYICGYGCESATDVPFMCSKTSRGVIIDINHSTITHSQKGNCNDLICIDFGYGVLMSGTNISHNSCKRNSACYFAYGYHGTGSEYLISSSIVNNTYSDNVILYLGHDYDGCSGNIKSCNIIYNGNIEGKASGSIIYQSSDLGNTYINQSCILNNIAQYIFDGFSDNFYYLTNCTIDKASSQVDVDMYFEEEASKSFINALVHIKTGNCEAMFDSVGSLSVLMTKKTRNPLLCITHCGRRLTIDVLRSMTYNILITFIPSI